MSSSDPDWTDEKRAKRIEELLYTIGGCEVAIRQNRYGKLGASPEFADAIREKQKTYLKKLERVMNGLPEED